MSSKPNVTKILKTTKHLSRIRRHFVALIFIAGSFATQFVAAAPIPVQSVQTNADGVTLTMSPGKMKLTVCSDSIIRVMYSPTATLPAGQTFAVTNTAWPVASFQVTDSIGSVAIATVKLKVSVDKTSGAVQFFDSSNNLLLAEPATGGKTTTAVTVNGESSYQPQQEFSSPADEFIYGLGQYQEGIWNWRGVPQQLRQVNTQIAVPMIVSSYGYGVLWNNASFTDFNPADTQVPLTSGAGTCTTGAAGDYVFIVKDGDRSSLIGVQVNGQTVAAITNMWVPYTISGKINLPASTVVSVTRLGGGSNAKIFARPLGNTTTFRSEVGDAIDYYFFYGPTADQIVAGYRQATGDAPLFSKAAYGFWQCRERYSSQSQILAAANQFRANQIPVDFIVQDWQYWGSHGWGAYEWDLSNYPDPTNMIAQLHTNNFKYMISVWSNPGGIVGNVLASMTNGVIPGSASPPWMDIFNPAVRSTRWSYMNSAFFSIGTDGWWQDATEPGDDGNSVSGVQIYTGSANRMRNSYPLFASQAVYEGQRATDSSKRVVNLTRSGYLGQQRYGAAVWSGDVNGDWLTLRRQLRAGLNYSITGLPYWTTDTGGFFHPSGQYTSTDYNELLTRWFQWSTFSPILRIHGYQTATEIWNWLPATQTNLIAYDKLRYRMLPYNYSVAWKITSERYTPMRPLVMDFAGDTNALNIADQYMFGPAFLACPVMTPQTTTRQVYLPNGASWVDFWTGEKFTGGQTITANAPTSIIPLMVRAGSIVPFGPALQYALEKTADPIELRVYPGADGQFTLYEDEGDSYAYETGSFATIPISWNDATKTLTFGARQGSFPGMLASRTFRVIWVYPGHGIGSPADGPADQQVIYNGAQTSVVMSSSPSAPAVPAVTPTPGVKQIQLNWIAPTNALSYIVKRSTTNGGPYVSIGTSTTTNFTDTNVVIGVTYYYVLVAANLAGQSAPSAQVSAVALSAPVGPSRRWDANPSSGLQSGNGTWDANTTAAWSADATGSNPLLVWATNGDALFFGGGVSTVTLSGSVQVHSISQGGLGTITTITNGTGLQFSELGGITNGIPNGNGALTIYSPIVLGGMGATICAEQPIQINGNISDGGCGFSKTGTNTFTLTGANSYNGATMIAAGTLSLKGSAAINAVQSSMTVSSGTVLNLDATGVGGTPTGDTMGAALTQSGADGTISGGGTLRITGGSADVLGLGNASGRHVYISLGAGGAIDVQGGIFRSGGWQAAYWDNNLGSINVAASAVFDVWDGNTITADTLTGSGKIINGSNTARDTTLAVGVNNGSGTFSGVIGGGTRAGANRIALIKLGSGTQLLAGVNTYKGPTTVNGGCLVIQGSLGTNTVTVNTGGALAGSGTVNGPVVLTSGNAAIQLQNGSPATLTLAGGLTLNNGNALGFDLGVTADQIALTAGNYTKNAGTVTINLTNLTGFAAGSYPLITGATGIMTNGFVLGNVPAGYAGTLSASSGTLSVALLVAVPATPTGLSATAGDGQVLLSWNSATGATGYNVRRSTANGGPYSVVAANTSATTFTNLGLANGTAYYYVVSATNSAGESANSTQVSAQPVSTAPLTFSYGLSGNQLQLSWPADHRGWRLEAQTNSLATGLGMNWVTVSGAASTNQVFLPISISIPSVFFRLTYP
jgi:alpha-D-xyloside xylohydrolase